jgi:predicted anti-sigma-YlaC factor YlaD
MTDAWTDRLSDYLDGELPPADRAALEVHLAECAECAETLSGLRRVVTRARALEDRPPAGDLWPAIAARIGGRRVPRRFSVSVPQLAAAGIALMAVSSAAGWVLHPGTPVASPNELPATSPLAATPARMAAAGTYDAAVADLERVLAQGRGRLDTATVRVLEQNLATIDRAIAQAQRAVAADSANLYLNSHLAATMRQKLDLLRQAAALVAAVS